MIKIKRIFCFFLLSVMIINYASVCCNSMTTEKSDIEPRYINVNNAQITLTTSNGKIVARILISGSTGTTYEGGILTLRRTVGSDTVFLENLRNLSSTTTLYSYYNNSHDAESGTYILKFAIYAVKNGVRERINLEKTLVV